MTVSELSLKLHEMEREGLDKLDVMDEMGNLFNGIDVVYNDDDEPDYVEIY